jgi:hypothetical protein
MKLGTLLGRLTNAAVCAALVTACGGVNTPEARAQVVSTNSYFVQHNFNFFPGGNLLPAVRGRWYDHAWVREPGRAAFDVTPAAQPAGWAPFGRDALIIGNQVFNTGGVLANRGIQPFGPAGGVRVDTAVVPPGPSQAFARSTISVNPFGPGGPVTGFVRSDGFASAVMTQVGTANAYSFSTSSVEVRGRALFAGRVIWGPTIRDTVAGSAFAQASRQRRRDPIYFRIFDDLGNQQLEEELLSIESEILGDGAMTWEDDQMVINAPGADFTIDMDGPFVIGGGSLNFQVRDNAVVTSIATGIFAGLLPGLGATGPFAFSLPTNLDLQYNLPTNLGDDVEFDFGGGSDVPAPGSIACVIAGIGIALRRRR